MVFQGKPVNGFSFQNRYPKPWYFLKTMKFWNREKYKIPNNMVQLGKTDSYDNFGPGTMQWVLTEYRERSLKFMTILNKEIAIAYLPCLPRHESTSHGSKTHGNTISVLQW